MDTTVKFKTRKSTISNVAGVVSYHYLLYNQRIREPQKWCDIYLATRRAQGDHPPTYIVTRCTESQYIRWTAYYV